jgi:hypothetical protein
MTTSFLTNFGRVEASRVMGEAIAEAARENREAGFTTASVIDGQLVVVPGKESLKDAEPEARKP